MRTIRELMDLTGRTALVTGGAGHLGLAAAAALSELGARVALADRREALDRLPPERLASPLDPDRTTRIGADLSDEGETRACVREAVARLQGLDVLVHSAAFVGTTARAGWAEPFDRQTVEAWDAALRVNLTAAFVLVQEAREALARSGHGSVIFVGSIYGVVGPDMRLYEGTGMANPAGYAASKGGLVQLARHLATLLAPRIRVNVVSPGGVWRGQPAAFVDRYVSRTPLGRMAAEEDVKGAIAFLASDLSTYVTGQNLIVDGGWTVW